MSINSRPYLFILGAILILFIFFACIRNLESGKQVADWGRRNERMMKGIVIAIFLVFGFALVPVALKAFLKMQAGIGNMGLPVIRSINQNAMKIVYGIWCVLALGLLIVFIWLLKSSPIPLGNLKK